MTNAPVRIPTIPEKMHIPYATVPVKWPGFDDLDPQHVIKKPEEADPSDETKQS